MNWAMLWAKIRKLEQSSGGGTAQTVFNLLECGISFTTGEFGPVELTDEQHTAFISGCSARNLILFDPMQMLYLTPVMYAGDAESGLVVVVMVGMSMFDQLVLSEATT